MSAVVLSVPPVGPLDHSAGNMRTYTVLDKSGVQIGDQDTFLTFVVEHTDKTLYNTTLKQTVQIQRADGTVTKHAKGTPVMVLVGKEGTHAFIQKGQKGGRRRTRRGRRNRSRSRRA